jgi:hypothetical protein
MSSTNLLVVVCTVVAFVAVVHLVFRGARRCLLQDILLDVKGFAPTQHIIGDDEFSALAVDEARNAICLISISDNRQHRIISCADLESVELLEDDISITKTSRSAAGGVLVRWDGSLQPVGEHARRITLRLRVNDSQSPVHDVLFLNLRAPRDGLLYRQSMDRALRWVGIVDGLIKRADAEDQGSQSSAVHLPLMHARLA